MISNTISSVCLKPELIENYEQAMADKTQVWHCHHRLETHFSDGTPRPKNALITSSELIALGIYLDRPPEELIFLTVKEHKRIHYKDKKRSAETKRKISDGHKGIKYGPLSNEQKQSLSKLYKGKHWKLVDGKRVWY